MAMACFFLGASVPAGGENESDTQAKVRVPVDSVGYALKPDQIEQVVTLSDSLEANWLDQGRMELEQHGGEAMIGCIAPHDDYLYAGRVYIHVMKRIEAPVVVLIGVCHAARRKGIQGKLVFDDYGAWAGPYGDVPVSGVRDQIIESLPPELVLVSDELHAAEHSLEAFIPFLQFFDPAVEIVPVLVTRLRGGLLERAAAGFAAALERVCSDRGWELGKDIAIVISADCVHYGDEAWGGRNYAPFGVGAEGFGRAVAQDLDIVNSSLVGEIDGSKIGLFREQVERDDLEWPYKVTWCGVYSIPFGLAVLADCADRAGREKPIGHLLRYGTSLDPGMLPAEIKGLGTTNISTLRHWVGYAAVGFW